MPLSRFGPSAQAVRQFTDRTKAQSAFWDCIDELVRDPGTLRTLVFYGVGGIGKTKLLRHLYENLNERIESRPGPNVRVHFLSLDAYEFSSPTRTLLALRNQLEIPCFLFDYALLRYWTTVGTSPLEIKQKGIAQDSIVWDFLEFVGDLGGVAIPVQLLTKGYERLKRFLVAKSDAYAEDIALIDGLTEPEIEARLPYYLGRALHEETTRSDRRTVCFFDSLEDPEARALATPGKGAGWLCELIAASGRGLFVLAGREYIRWGEADLEWDDVLDQHLLGRLSDTDADQFLSAVPIPDRNIRAAIVALAEGLPLYLDLCVTIYARIQAKGLNVAPEEFEIPQREVVDRFLSHLPRPEREATRLAALVRWFDRSILAALIQDFNIGYPTSLYDEFISASHVSEIDPTTGLHKIHDTVRAQIDRSASDHLRLECVRCLLSLLSKESEIRRPGQLAELFAQAVSLLVEAGGGGEFEAGNVLDVGSRLEDCGLWQEVEDVTTPLLGRNTDPAQAMVPLPQALRAALMLLGAISKRRTGRLIEAQALFSELLDDASHLGAWEPIARFHSANVTRLLGGYTEAEPEYRALVEAGERGHLRGDLYTKVARQHADLLFLQGWFNDAEESLDRILSISETKSLQWAETLRILGHIHRFNFDLASAEVAYRRSLHAAEAAGAIGLIAKLKTNLCETLCWQDPHAAIAIGEEAVGHNESLGSTIEVGKAKAALAIARVLTNEEGAPDAAKALQLQQSAGYRSGVLFGIVAAAVCAKAKGNQDSFQSRRSEARTLSSQLGVYSFTDLPLAVLAGERASVEHVADWLDFERTYSSCRDVLAALI